MSDERKSTQRGEDSWARVELWRWQYGGLPGSDDMRPLSVPAGLRGMAEAIRVRDLKNFPSPHSVQCALEYAARIIEKLEEGPKP